MRLRVTVLPPAIVWIVLAAGCVAVDNVTGISQARELQQAGVAAQARIIKIWDSGMTLNLDPVVWFELIVYPDGQPPYTATTKSPISRLDVPRFQPGARVPVRYDPADPARVSLDVYPFK
jgi:hypothetical protein